MKLAEKNPAIELLEKFVKAYNHRHMKEALSVFSTRHKVLLIGTGVDEVRQNLDEIQLQIERDWAQSESNILTRVSDYITSGKPCCWADATYKATFVIDGKTHVAPHLRGSIYCSEEEDGWKVTHMHCSFPHLSESKTSSFPTTTVQETPLSQLIL